MSEVKGIEPGGQYENQCESKGINPEDNQRDVMGYRAFQKALHPKVGVIYYPACGNDINPTTAFPESRIIYVESDEKLAKLLQGQGHEAHFGSASGTVRGDPEIAVYSPDVPVDVLILSDPSMDPQVSVETVAEGGFVLANDYHGTANQIAKRPDFEFVGMIRKSAYDSDIQDPENFWEEVKTDEEFKASGHSMAYIDYDDAANVVRQVTGKAENVLVNYKKILQEASSQVAGGLVYAGYYKHNGKNIPLVGSEFPPKKPKAARFYVFKRKKKK